MSGAGVLRVGLRRPLQASKASWFVKALLVRFPGETSSTFSWVWSKLLGEGPRGGWLLSSPPVVCLQNCPHSAAPPLSASSSYISLLLLLFLSLVPFFLSFSSNAFFSCPFPPSLSFGRTYWPYWHWKFLQRLGGPEA